MREIKDFSARDLKVVDKVLDLFSNYKQEHQFNYNMVNKLDKLTQDLLHKLELEELTPGERSKIATRLRNVRRDRRYYKDIADALGNLVDLDRDGNGRVPAQALANRIKQYIKWQTDNTRTYRPKIKSVELS